MNRLAAIPCLVALLACGASPDSSRAHAGDRPPPPATVAREAQTRGPAAAGPNDAAAVADFDALVVMVRRYHVFAPQTEKNLGKRWDDDLPRLRAEFLAAMTPEALQVALWHFGNSLHDVLCQYRA